MLYSKPATSTVVKQGVTLTGDPGVSKDKAGLFATPEVTSTLSILLTKT